MTSNTHLLELEPVAASNLDDTNDPTGPVTISRDTGAAAAVVAPYDCSKSKPSF